MSIKNGAKISAASAVFGELIEQVSKNEPDQKKSEFLPKERVLAPKGTLPRNLAEEACKKLIEQSNISASEIDFLLYSTSLADTVNIGFGPYLLNAIGANQSSLLQVDCSCASFLSQLEIADALIQKHHYEKILVVNVSHMISRLEKARSQFQGKFLGEACGAVIVEPGEKRFFIENASIPFNEPSPSPYPMRLEDHDWYAEGSPFQFKGDFISEDFIDSKKLNYIKDNFVKALKNSKLDIHELDAILCNTPNQKIIEALADRLNISSSKFKNSFQKHGDLAQATIPTQLAEFFSNQKESSTHIGLISFSLDLQHISAGILEI